MKVINETLNQKNYLENFDRRALGHVKTPSNEHEFSYVERTGPLNQSSIYHPITYHDKYYHKTPELNIRNTTIVVIGDSLGRQIYEDYGARIKLPFRCGIKDWIRLKNSTVPAKNFKRIFWKTSNQERCAMDYVTHSLSPYKIECFDATVRSEFCISGSSYGSFSPYGSFYWAILNNRFFGRKLIDFYSKNLKNDQISTPDQNV